MNISYNNLWKVLIDRGMSPAELRKEADFAPNTLTKLRQNQPVALTVLLKICEVLNTDIGSVLSFVPDEKPEKSPSELDLNYFNISKVLSLDFSFVYYVNLSTNSYVRYKAQENREMLPISSGEDFFADYSKFIESHVYPKDKDYAFSSFNKENILKSLELSSVLTITYRLKKDNSYVYSRAKIILTSSNGVEYIVVGISDVDSSVRKEMQQTSALNNALKLASRDPLTNVGNVNAFKQAEKEYNTKIANNELNNFSIIFCDVNDLKITNDTLGHAAGDLLIKYVSSTICSVFKHSPVFRVGGDEFVVFVSGEDFDNREDLFRNLRTLNRKQALEGKNVFSCGMATFNPETDYSVASVIERADSVMYYNKRELKSIQLARLQNS